jgi:hypothetical protein
VNKISKTIDGHKMYLGELTVDLSRRKVIDVKYKFREIVSDKLISV